jgi:Carbohydrate family 9 binding domain-like
MTPRRPSAPLDRTAVIVIAWLSCLPAASSGAPGGDEAVLVSRRAASDFALTADPEAKPWKGIRGVVAEKDRRGQVVAGHRTEIRSRWTPENLYLLFVAPYEELNLKPDPATGHETDRLWNWDVAEAFIGTDFEEIRRYKEFQVSPQGEWVDLAIDRGASPPNHDASWDSGYEVKARLDRDRRVWYGEMRIPMKALGPRPARVGVDMRINLYRIQGPPPERRHINWRPVMSDSFHTPEAFGRLRLEEAGDAR